MASRSLCAGAPLILGSFSAGSNVTGIAPDVHAIAALLHRYGAIAAFDYASAGSCKHINCAGAQLGSSEAHTQHSSTHGIGPCHRHDHKHPDSPSVFRSSAFSIRYISGYSVYHNRLSRERPASTFNSMAAFLTMFHLSAPDDLDFIL
jgi:hypothetical protein